MGADEVEARALRSSPTARELTHSFDFGRNELDRQRKERHGDHERTETDLRDRHTKDARNDIYRDEQPQARSQIDAVDASAANMMTMPVRKRFQWTLNVPWGEA